MVVHIVGEHWTQTGDVCFHGEMRPFMQQAFDVAFRLECVVVWELYAE